MYIFEFIGKLRKEKEKCANQPQPQEQTKREPEVCRHILVPIDSTKKVLACSKCGFLIRRENLPKRANNDNSRNFFNKD